VTQRRTTAIFSRLRSLWRRRRARDRRARKRPMPSKWSCPSQSKLTSRSAESSL